MIWRRAMAFFATLGDLHPPPPAPPRRPPFVFAPATLPGTGDKRESAAINGVEAAKLLENELLRWSLGEIRERIREGMETAPIRDTEGMQLLRMQFEVVKAFEQNLASLIADGKLAEADLAAIVRDREVEKRYGKVVI